MSAAKKKVRKAFVRYAVLPIVGGRSGLVVVTNVRRSELPGFLVERACRIIVREFLKPDRVVKDRYGRCPRKAKSEDLPDLRAMNMLDQRESAARQAAELDAYLTRKDAETASPQEVVAPVRRSLVEVSTKINDPRGGHVGATTYGDGMVHVFVDRNQFGSLSRYDLANRIRQLADHVASEHGPALSSASIILLTRYL